MIINATTQMLLSGFFVSPLAANAHLPQPSYMEPLPPTNLLPSFSHGCPSMPVLDTLSSWTEPALTQLAQQPCQSGTAVNRAALDATPSPPAIHARTLSPYLYLLSSITAYLTTHQPQRIANILDLLSGAELARLNNIFYLSSLLVFTVGLCIYSIVFPLAYPTFRPKTLVSPRHGSVLADSKPEDEKPVPPSRRQRRRQ